MRDSGQKSIERQNRHPASEPEDTRASSASPLFVDNRPAATAQRRLAASIHASPGMVAQRQQLSRTFGSALQLQGAPLQCRGTPLDLPRAGVIVANRKTTILGQVAVQQATADFTALQQHWPARLLLELGNPAVNNWNTLRTQLDNDCLAAPSTDGDTLGANIRNLIQLGGQLSVAAVPAHAALQPALTALTAANNSPPLAELVLLLGTLCGGVDQAVPQLVALGQLLQVAGAGAAALVNRACPLVHNSAASAVNVALYLTSYSANPKADLVSEQVLSEEGLDISAAAGRMTTLATWGYDLALEGWSKSQSDTLAQEGVDKIKQDGQTEKLRLEGGLPADPGSKPVRGKKEKKGAYDSRVQGWNKDKTGREQGQAAILIEEGNVTGADAKKPGLKKQRHDEMSGFMVSWTASLGVELAGWTLQLAEGRQPVAEALATLQASAQLTGLDKQDWASWAIGLSSAATGIAVLQRAVELVIQAGCDPQVARIVAAYQLTDRLSTPQLQKVVAAMATSPTEIAEIINFLRTQLPFGDALDALYRAVTVGHVPVKALAAFCGSNGVELTAWALTHGVGNLKDSEKLLSLIGDKVSQEQLAKLLKKGSTDDLLFLLGRVDFNEPNPVTLLKLYTRADSLQLRTLLAPPAGFFAHKLELWLVTKGYVVADIITLLGLTSAAVIEGMVNNSGTNPTAVLAAYRQLNAGNGEDVNVLKTLIQTYPGKNLPVLVGAHLSKGGWSQGSFTSAMESIFYHHNKHGAGQSVEQYTQDAQACWGGGGAFDWTDEEGRSSRKIQGPPGGTFTPTGAIYSFWYS